MGKRVGVGLIMFALLGFVACGGSGSGTGTSTVKIDVTGSANPEIQEASGTLFDASATGTGTTGTGTIKSTLDEAFVSCKFTVLNGATTQDISIDGDVIYQVVEDAANCDVANACVVCKPTDTENNCDISCTGTVPSNADTDGSAFEIYFTATGTFTTDMPNVADGGFRLQMDVDNWSEFDLTNGVDVATCVNDGEIIASEVENSSFNGEIFQLSIGDSSASAAYYMSNEGTLETPTCTSIVSKTVTQTLNTLSGNDTGAGGQTTVLSGGNVDFGLKICDDYNNCDPLTLD